MVGSVASKASLAPPYISGGDKESTKGGSKFFLDDKEGDLESSALIFLPLEVSPLPALMVMTNNPFQAMTNSSFAGGQSRQGG